MGDIIALVIVGAIVVVVGVASVRSLRHRNRPIERPPEADAGVTMHWISRHDDWSGGGSL
jgi:hypothetical protein